MEWLESQMILDLNDYKKSNPDLNPDFIFAFQPIMCEIQRSDYVLISLKVRL